MGLRELNGPRYDGTGGGKEEEELFGPRYASGGKEEGGAVWASLCHSGEKGGRRSCPGLVMTERGEKGGGEYSWSRCAGKDWMGSTLGHVMPGRKRRRGGGEEEASL